MPPSEIHAQRLEKTELCRPMPGASVKPNTCLSESERSGCPQPQYSAAPKRQGGDSMSTAIQSPLPGRQVPVVVDYERELDVLASIEPSDALFLSCYLDLREGQSECTRFLERRLGELRSTLSGSTLLDLDQAVELVRAVLDEIWDEPEGLPRSVAIFARGLAGGQALSVLPLDRRLSSRVRFYPVPDLVPLVGEPPTADAYTLLLARGGAVQVLDVQGDEFVSKAWASYRPDTPSVDAGRASTSQRRLRSLFRGLASPYGSPVVVAGDGNCLDELVAALPARAAKRLRDVMRVPAQLDGPSAMAFVQRRVASRHDLRGERLAARLLRRIASGGPAVGGARQCHDALCRGRVESLVIAREPGLAAMQRCDGCGAIAPVAAGGGCGHCGTARVSAWDPEVELARVARQKRVPVVAVEADRLRVVGGVACLLREPEEHRVVTMPRAATGGLDLVA
jgi:hypothetical protein